MISSDKEHLPAPNTAPVELPTETRVRPLRLMALICMVFLFLPLTLARAEGSSGQFELGARSTASLFNSQNSAGYGTGGQFRIRFLESLNSEWFADYLANDVQSLGYREDAHIGWSVMFYPLPKPYTPQAFTPYLLAGHCFDYTRIARYSDNSGQERVSSAVQAGLGSHFHLDERFNLSLSAQYMLHLGADLHTNVANNVLTVTKENNAFEGHLLLTFSLNYRVGNLW